MRNVPIPKRDRVVAHYQRALCLGFIRQQSGQSVPILRDATSRVAHKPTVTLGPRGPTYGMLTDHYRPRRA